MGVRNAAGYGKTDAVLPLQQLGARAAFINPFGMMLLIQCEDERHF
jgi:hypothetical protein